MYTDLIYQASSHDCGPSSVINGFRHLFEREEIPPELIPMIYTALMNEHDEAGRPCRGTDAHAMAYLSSRLNEYAPLIHLPLLTEFYKGTDVTLNEDSEILKWINHGGVSVMRIFVGVGHYVLITKVTDTDVYIWDPFLAQMPKLQGVSYHTENRREYNLIVSRERFARDQKEMFMLSEWHMRNTLLMKRTD